MLKLITVCYWTGWLRFEDDTLLGWEEIDGLIDGLPVLDWFTEADGLPELKVDGWLDEVRLTEVDG